MKNVRQRFPSQAGAGFTIIELLVAVAITAAMAAVMLAMTTNIMSSWTRASGSLSAQTQARTALDYLQRDLESAIFRSDGNVWFAVDTLNWQGQTPGPNLWQLSDRGKPQNNTPEQEDSAWDPERSRFGWAGVWLRFFVADPDVNAVSYQIVRRTPVKSTSLSQEVDSRARYMLYRTSVPSESTFKSGYDILSSRYNPGAQFGGNADGALRRANEERGDNPDVDSDEVQLPDRGTLVASNVVDFGVRLFWKTLDQDDDHFYRRIFPDPDFNNEVDIAHRSPPLPGQAPQPEDHNPGNYGVYDYPDGDPTGANRASTRIPNVAEINLRILTDEGAKLLSNYEAGLIEGSWWDIVEEHSKVFTRRVVLRNAPETR